MHTTTECQQRLIVLGYLPETYVDNGITKQSDDGRFGERSLDAYNHYRATLGKGPVVQASMAELNVDLFPNEFPLDPPKPRSNPLDNPIIRIGLGILLNQLTKGLIPMNFLTGYKTFIIGGILIICGAVEFFGLQIPGMSGDPATLIMTGIGMITGRLGAKTEAAKVSGQ